jgi:hypothetical protein
MSDAPPKNSGSLDIDCHESTHSRNIRKAMSTRYLLPNRQDDLLRSGSTHQLLTRPTPSGSLLSLPLPPARPAPAGAAESLATEDTGEESDSEDSGGSFCDAEGDCAADKEYLRKDLGASLHSDDLDFESGDEKGKDMGGDTDDDDDELIKDIKNRMKMDEAKEASS